MPLLMGRACQHCPVTGLNRELKKKKSVSWGNTKWSSYGQKEFGVSSVENGITSTSLVVQWSRICLLIQRTSVASLGRELRSNMPWSMCAPIGVCAPQLESPGTPNRDSMCPNRRSCMPEMKIPHAGAKTQHCQIKEYFYKCNYHMAPTAPPLEELKRGAHMDEHKRTFAAEQLNSCQKVKTAHGCQPCNEKRGPCVL